MLDWAIAPTRILDREQVRASSPGGAPSSWSWRERLRFREKHPRLDPCAGDGRRLSSLAPTDDLVVYCSNLGCHASKAVIKTPWRAGTDRENMRGSCAGLASDTTTLRQCPSSGQTRASQSRRPPAHWFPILDTARHGVLDGRPAGIAVEVGAETTRSSVGASDEKSSPCACTWIEPGMCSHETRSRSRHDNLTGAPPASLAGTLFTVEDADVGAHRRI